MPLAAAESAAALRARYLAAMPCARLVRKRRLCAGANYRAQITVAAADRRLFLRIVGGASELARVGLFGGLECFWLFLRC